MAIFITSDLHITSPSEPKYQALVALLAEQTGQASTVILAGDIFDLFLGNHAFFRAKYAGFLLAGKKFLEAGGEIIFVEGNHDFDLQGLWDHPRARIAADALAYQNQDLKLFIDHGDLVNSRDYGYRILRFCLRGLATIHLFRFLPGALLESLGKQSSKVSRLYTAQSGDSSPQAEATRQLFRNYAKAKFAAGYDFVYLGHSHLRDHLEWKDSQRLGHYWNLGFDPECLPLVRIEGKKVEAYRQSYGGERLPCK